MIDLLGPSEGHIPAVITSRFCCHPLFFLGSVSLQRLLDVSELLTWACSGAVYKLRSVCLHPFPPFQVGTVYLQFGPPLVLDYKFSN